MTIIDLRPYENEPHTKGLAGLILDHYRTIRGATQIIYDVPDEIWVTEAQSKQFDEGVEIDGHYIPIVVLDNE